MVKKYAQRDIDSDAVADHYDSHVDAMTGEGLYSMQQAWSEFINALDSGDEARCRLAITTLAAEMHRAAQSQEDAE